MAARFLLRRGAAAPAMAVLAAGYAVLPRTPIHAEAPPSEPETLKAINRKPIYDEPEHIPEPPSTEPRPKPSQSPGPTDRLASQIAKSRLFLHGYAAKAEDTTNDVLTSAFNLEHSFTSTVASLAPAPQTGEHVMPGALYVLISAMGSSILVRNRNILLRASFPLAVGIGAGYTIIPHTMENVGDLIWEYEKKFPVLADTHIRVKDRVTKFVETGIAHSKMSVGMLEDKIGEAREKLEGWVRKGR